MITAFKLWLQRRRLEAMARHFDAGFDWAAGQLLRGVRMEVVLATIDATGSFNLEPGEFSFDDGAHEAVNMWRNAVSLEPLA